MKNQSLGLAVTEFMFFGYILCKLFTPVVLTDTGRIGDVLHKLLTGCYAMFVSYWFVFYPQSCFCFCDVLPVVENYGNIMSTSVTFLTRTV